MKKTVLLAVVALTAALEISAHEPAEGRLRRRYINLSYSIPKMTVGDSYKHSADFGAGFTLGRSYYLHRKPIAGLIRFGIDATWLDLNYSQYTTEVVSVPIIGTDVVEEIGGWKLHQGELGLQVGPSITLTPVKRMMIHAYFRYAPTFAVVYGVSEESISGGYASFFVTGGSVSYGAIGVGAEARWGSGTYKRFGGDSAPAVSNKNKVKTTGWRVYLNFRF